MVQVTGVLDDTHDLDVIGRLMVQQTHYWLKGLYRVM
jgi:hypothetical protein